MKKHILSLLILCSYITIHTAEQATTAAATLHNRRQAITPSASTFEGFSQVALHHAHTENWPLDPFEIEDIIHEIASSTGTTILFEELPDYCLHAPLRETNSTTSLEEETEEEETEEPLSSEDDDYSFFRENRSRELTNLLRTYNISPDDTFFNTSQAIQALEEYVQNFIPLGSDPKIKALKPSDRVQTCGQCKQQFHMHCVSQLLMHTTNDLSSRKCPCCRAEWKNRKLYKMRRSSIHQIDSKKDHDCSICFEPVRPVQPNKERKLLKQTKRTIYRTLESEETNFDDKPTAGRKRKRK